MSRRSQVAETTANLALRSRRSRRPALPRSLPIIALAVALALGLLCEALGASVAHASRPPQRVIYLQPLGSALPASDTTLVARALTAFTGMKVSLLPRRPLPRRAFYRPRRRYRAEKLLGYLRERMPADAFRILGLTASDISTTKGRYRDWGILGLATIEGRAGVVSTYRTHKGARSRRHARQRLAKVAVHEIGHTLGLEHCPSRGCLMEDARGKVATSDREHDFCVHCRARLRRHGYIIPATPAIAL